MPEPSAKASPASISLRGKHMRFGAGAIAHDPRLAGRDRGAEQTEAQPVPCAETAPLGTISPTLTTTTTGPFAPAIANCFSTGQGGPWELYDLSRGRCQFEKLAAHSDRVQKLASPWKEQDGRVLAFRLCAAKRRKQTPRVPGGTEQMSGLHKPGELRRWNQRDVARTSSSDMTVSC
jgi:hypothetical protein